MSQNNKNRLSEEVSPYLLQHASNPVDWYPWGEKAFERARREDKPIFLSIGYSTCHWCHVMERESFEDEAVARLLNESFVSIKVDREERPDVDGVYMAACHVISGGGGWPLTVMMTPDKLPFFAATYLPKEDVGGRAGLVRMLGRVAGLWRTNRVDLESDARRAMDMVISSNRGTRGSAPGRESIQQAFEMLDASFDEEHAGFGRSVKFPSPHQLVFLMAYHRRTGDTRALEMARRTLQAMRRGGIFDHLGYGFHRYSTEPTWLVPHFEKMLYDQALLTLAYLDLFELTGREEHRRTAEEILEYVLRDLAAPQGAFFTAEDADSEGAEGRFYLWTRREVEEVLEAERAAAFCDRFGVTAEGNFEDPHGHTAPGSCVLRLAPDLPDTSLDAELERSRDDLLIARGARTRPSLDDKILTDLNGLMVAALARAARVLGDDRYLDRAIRAWSFIEEHLVTADGLLLHRYRSSRAGIDGTLDDYAFVTFALLELRETTKNPVYLAHARRLTEIALERFRTDDGGALGQTRSDSRDLPARVVPLFDGAAPSGNSVLFASLVAIAELTGSGEARAAAEEIATGFAEQTARAPEGFAFFLTGLDRYLDDNEKPEEDLR